MLLNKHNLQIADLASKEESRYTLQAIYVSPKWTATTNGHYLVTVTLPKHEDAQFPCIEGFTPTNGETRPFLLHRDDALAIANAVPTKETIPVLNCASVGGTPEQLQIAVTDLESPKIFSPASVDGQFPDIDAVIPDSKKMKLTIGLDAEYLMKLCKSAIASCRFRAGVPVTIKMELEAPEKAIKMTAHNADTKQEWMAVLMPKRI